MSNNFQPVFSVMTWNLFKWKGVQVHDWPGERKEGMRKTIDSLKPDIICTQETAPEYLDTILSTDERLRCIVPTDEIVHANLAMTGSTRSAPFHSDIVTARRGNSGKGESEKFEGWLEEGNILWRSDKFEYKQHGSVDVGIQDAEGRKPKRRLFWVRLRVLDGSARTVLISTAHLTWEGGSGKEQVPPYTNERTAQAARIVDALRGIVHPDEPIVFTGDMNDSWHVPFLMREAGLVSHDFILNLPTEITHPARPCFHEERIPSQTRDWIFTNGGLRPILGRVCSDMVLGLSRHPSDHFPVFTIFQFI